MVGLTVFFQILLLLYHQITTLVDFYPFNNIRKYTLRLRLVECLVNGVVMAIPPVGYLFHSPWMIGAAGWIYVGIMIGAWLSWYQKYLFGATAAQQAEYDHIFRPTIQVLPDSQGHPRPNLEHVILHGILVITLVMTWSIRS